MTASQALIYIPQRVVIVFDVLVVIVTVFVMVNNIRPALAQHATLSSALSYTEKLTSGKTAWPRKHMQ